jgi:dienelactone hydrolase
MRKILVAIMTAVALSGCCASGVHKHPMAAAPMTDKPKDLGPYPVYVFPGKDGDAPVLRLHELPGFLPQTRMLAERLAGEGFTVYVPLLFGSPGGGASETTRLFRVFLSPRWRAFRRGRTAPIADELNVIADRIHAETGRDVGVIGMCLTGNLGVALLSRNEHVTAAVAAQPSLPLCCKDDIALGKEDSAPKADFLFFRFHNDRISEGKLGKFRERFGKLVHADELTLPPPAPGSEFRHATLTIELFDKTSDHSPCAFKDWREPLAGGDLRPECAYQKTVKYLHERLDRKQAP